jgi:intein/homing endonuclease
MIETKKAFIAGFLDADGSIYVRLKPNKDYRFDFQVAPYIVFFQKKEKKKILEYLKNLLQVGYLRTRRDGIVEYTIGDVAGLRKVIEIVLPYIVLKERQLELLGEILDFKSKIKTGKDFLRLAKMIDRFEGLNYSKKRFVNSQQVESHLRKQALL